MAAQGYPSTNRERVQHVRDVLGDPRRRGVLQELARLGGDQISLETLVDQFVNRESTDRDDLASDLHHIHLPTLADLGVIAYDAEHQHVTHHTCRVVDVLALAGEAMEAPDG